MLTNEGFERRLLRGMSIDSVLEEQALQRGMGIYDDEGLARLYSDYSTQCHEAAHLTGLEDEKSAMSLLRSDSD